MSGMLGRLLAGLAAAVLAVAGAAAQTSPPRSNACAFVDVDQPCRTQNGAYRALVPNGPGPYPTVVYLYGSLGLSTRVTDADYFRQNVVRRGFALIVPAALDVTYRGGRVGTGWGRRARARSHPRDDIAFLREVIVDAQRRHNIDPRNLIFVGQSDGGFLIWEIACHMPGMGAAFAVHAASYGGPLPRRCERPVRFLQVHGQRDDVVPFRGELRTGGRLMAADLDEALALMSRTNKCQREGRPVRFHGFERISWEDCAGQAALDRLVHAGGHNPPRSWLPAVLDWYEETSFVPAESVTRRVGEREGFRRATTGGGGLFRSAPQ